MPCHQGQGDRVESFVCALRRNRDTQVCNADSPTARLLYFHWSSARTICHVDPQYSIEVTDMQEDKRTGLEIIVPANDNALPNGDATDVEYRTMDNGCATPAIHPRPPGMLLYAPGPLLAFAQASRGPRHSTHLRKSKSRPKTSVGSSVSNSHLSTTVYSQTEVAT